MNPVPPTRRERIAGALLGLLVGDALGVPYEFHPPEQIPPLELIEFAPPPGYARAHARVSPGTWSDDGAQALCLLASLLDCGKLDPDDLAHRFLRWYEEGYLAVDANVFDVGITTGNAIRAFRAGTPALDAGPSGERDNGNGSLMRVLPLALWHTGPDAALVADARAQSRVTHGHPRAQLCCALYCLWARHILDAAPDPWTAAVVALRALHPNGTPEREEIEWAIRPDDPPEGRGSGYVVDTLRSARWALAAGDYEHVVKAAVSLGNDTDTTACVAGGLAGLRDGIAAIPQRWRDALRGQDLLMPLLERLLSPRA